MKGRRYSNSSKSKSPLTVSCKILWSKHRSDDNPDDLLRRTNWIMAAPEPSPLHMNDVRQEAENKIISSERDYLDSELQDMVHIGAALDPVVGKLLTVANYVVERTLKLIQIMQKVSRIGSAHESLTLVTDEGNQLTGTCNYIITIKMATFRVVARIINAFVSILVLLLPIVVLNFVDSSGMRLLVVFVSTTIFISALMILTSAGTMEVFVCGATYSAVLVVFVSQNGVGSSGSSSG
ncbi:hypothetical protein HDK77DRAFT_30533 [Phyllosticta capitalensis]